MQICVGVVFYLDMVPSRHHVDFSTVICFLSYIFSVRRCGRVGEVYNLFISVASSVRIEFNVIRPDISMRLLLVLSFFGGSVSWGHSIVITMVSCRDTAGILIEKPANP